MTERSSDPIPPAKSQADLGRTLSESDSHHEHRCALEATLFHTPTGAQETVFELSRGKLVLHPRRP